MNDFLSLMQRFVALESVGPSAVRNQGKGVLSVIRDHLTELDLNSLPAERRRSGADPALQRAGAGGIGSGGGRVCAGALRGVLGRARPARGGGGEGDVFLRIGNEAGGVDAADVVAQVGVFPIDTKMGGGRFWSPPIFCVLLLAPDPRKDALEVAPVGKHVESPDPL